MRKRIISVFVTVWLLALAGNAFALDLFSGKLTVHGIAQTTVQMPTHKETSPDQLHDYDFHNIRGTLKLETLWHAYEGESYNINVYSIFKNYYDKAYDIDSGYGNYISDFSGHRSLRNELRSYTTFRDICREFFIDVANPLFQVRLGKQVVSWGETSFSRMADIVNPIDARGVINPVVPDFSQMKQGLWMARFYYTNPDMWQNMTLELLIIPDFQPTRVYPAGHHMMHPSAFNMMQNPNEVLKARYRDKPKSWGSPEIGFKIRGFTGGFDWSLQYLHHRNDNPVTQEGKALLSALPALFGIGRTEVVYHYAWQHTIGATFNKPLPFDISIIPGTSLKMSGILFKGEFIWEKDRDINQTAGFDVRVREIDRYAGVLGWDCKIYLPWITPRYRNKLLNSSTQLFMEWVPDRHRIDSISPWSTQRKKGHHYAAVTESLSYAFWHSRIIPAVNLNYNLTEGSLQYALALVFKPTYKWGYSLVFADFIEYGRETDNGDMLIFDITYEF